MNCSQSREEEFVTRGEEPVENFIKSKSETQSEEFEAEDNLFNSPCDTSSSSLSSMEEEMDMKEQEPPRQTGTVEIPTAIIFDWDDTLLPSHAIHKWGHSPGNHANLSPKEKALLKTSEDEVIKILSKALELAGDGNVMIITDAQNGWIDISAEVFFPRVVPLLKRCHIVSARSTYESIDRNPCFWKMYAFQDVLQNYFQCEFPIVLAGPSGEEDDVIEIVQKILPPNSPRNPHPTVTERTSAPDTNEGTIASSKMSEGLDPDARHYWSPHSKLPFCHQLAAATQMKIMPTQEQIYSMMKSVVSIGDGPSERNACQTVCHFSNCLSKIVQLKRAPSVPELIRQQQILLWNLANIVSTEESHVIDLSSVV